MLMITDKMSSLRGVLTLLLTLFCVVYVSGIENIDADKKQKIDDFINSLLFSCGRHHYAGMNFAIVYQGEIAYTTGYGVRNLGMNLVIYFLCTAQFRILIVLMGDQCLHERPKALLLALVCICLYH